MDKSEMRKYFLKIRNDEPPESRAHKSVQISNRLFDFDEYKKAQTVFVYESFGSEVETALIIERCKSDGKKVAVPKTKKHYEMDFVLGSGEIVLPDETTLILTPGIAFSEDCFRIGYGKAYYDKYLKDKKYLSAIGLAFSLQMVKHIDIKEHDIKLNKVLTEASLWE